MILQEFKTYNFFTKKLNIMEDVDSNDFYIPNDDSSEQDQIQDPLNSEEIYKNILHNFPPQTDSNIIGACWLLPDGRFIDVTTHGEIDQYVFTYLIDEFNDIDSHPEDNPYPNGIMLDKYNCIRLNNGYPFRFDRYITVPKDPITNDQKYSLKSWLENYKYDEIPVGTLDGQMVTKETFNISSIINCIQYYYNTGKLR